MNERIKELNHQALSIVMNGDDPDGDVERMYIPSEFTKKFAELIVRECAGVAKLTDDDDGADYSSGRFWAGNDILTHFGVQE